MIQLTIIVPVFNTLPYLQQCLDSILSQKCDAVELIVINDGSTDGCGIFLEKYYKANGGFKFFNLTKNKGLSYARNIGINNAQGKYIAFVDSDDFLQPNILQKLLTQLKKFDCDVLLTRWEAFAEDVDEPIYKSGSLDARFFNKLSACQFCNQLVLTNLRLSMAQRYVVKRDLIEKHHLRFQETYNEDLIWSAKVLVYSTSTKVFFEHFYNYRIRHAGLSRVVNQEKIDDLGKIAHELSMLAKEHADHAEFLLARSKYVENLRLIFQSRLATTESNKP